MNRMPVFTLVICGMITCAGSLVAGQAYLVSDRTAGIFRMEDINGDGDALDVGENTLWGTGFTLLIEMETFGGAVYAVEEGFTSGTNPIVRLQDFNGDGDALDVGERVHWAEGLFNPRGITVDPLGNFFVADITDDNIRRLVDLNGDGDALDAGENSLYAEGINGATTVMSVSGQLIVTAFDGDTIHRLVDLNGDLDALDVGENLVVAPTINEPLGLLDDGNGGFYFSSRTADTVYHAKDRNGDGDFLDVAEVLSYADFVYGGVNGSWDMTPFDSGGFLLADYLDGQVLHVQDRNGDGDALDVGDVNVFADGFGLPVDIVRLPSNISSADFDQDDDVDGFDFLVWQRGFGFTGQTDNSQGDANFDGTVGSDDLAVWQSQYSSTSLVAAATAVPEPSASFLVLLGTINLHFHRNRVG